MTLFVNDFVCWWLCLLMTYVVDDFVSWWHCLSTTLFVEYFLCRILLSLMTLFVNYWVCQLFFVNYVACQLICLSIFYLSIIFAKITLFAHYFILSITLFVNYFVSGWHCFSMTSVCPWLLVVMNLLMVSEEDAFPCDHYSNSNQLYKHSYILYCAHIIILYSCIP